MEITIKTFLQLVALAAAFYFLFISTIIIFGG